MKKVRPLEWLAVLGIVLLFAAILFPVSTGDRVAKPRPCVVKLKHGLRGLIEYANDADDRFPPSVEWMDAALPYVRDEAAWRCPSVLDASYGYALNEAMSTAKPTGLPNPSASTLVYDSTRLVRNASDAVASLPRPGRHDGGDTFGYADGHAKMRKVP